jgi:hypothetical protein
VSFARLKGVGIVVLGTRRTSPMSNFDDYMSKLKKVKLDPSRKNLKPVDPSLTFEQYLAIAIKEGEELLAAEEKAKAPSVKSTPKTTAALEDALGKMSDNPYVRARIQVLQRMKPEARSVIENMEKGTLDKDTRYDTFCKAVNVLGEKFYLEQDKNNKKN